jgi:hypothetical protein
MRISNYCVIVLPACTLFRAISPTLFRSQTRLVETGQHILKFTFPLTKGRDNGTLDLGEESWCKFQQYFAVFLYDSFAIFDLVDGIEVFTVFLLAGIRDRCSIFLMLILDLKIVAIGCPEYCM